MKVTLINKKTTLRTEYDNVTFVRIDEGTLHFAIKGVGEKVLSLAEYWVSAV